MQQRELEAWLRVLTWNQDHPAGTLVRYDSFWRWPDVKVFRTRSRAVVGPGHIPMVWITRHPCAVSLDKLQLADEAEAPPLQRDLSNGSVSYWLAFKRSSTLPSPLWLESATHGGRVVSSLITHPPLSLSVCKKVNKDAAAGEPGDHWPSSLTPLTGLVDFSLKSGNKKKTLDGYEQTRYRVRNEPHAHTEAHSQREAAPSRKQSARRTLPREADS